MLPIPRRPRARQPALRIHVRSHRDRRKAIPRRGRHRARSRAARRRARQDDHDRSRPARRRRRQASIGRPLVADAVVSAEVLRQDLADKVISFKYRPKARSRVKKGHRQELTVLRVTDVRLGDRSAAEEARQAEALRQTERQRLEEAAATQAAKDAELAAKLAAQKPAPCRGRPRPGAVAVAPPQRPTRPPTTRPRSPARPPSRKGAKGRRQRGPGRTIRLGEARPKPRSAPKGGRGASTGKAKSAESERPSRPKKES